MPYEKQIRVLQGPICVLPSGSPLPVDEDLCNDLIRKHNRLSAFGYLPPLLVEHERSGEIKGRVKSLEVEPAAEGRPLGLVANVEFYEADAEAKLASGEWSYFSPCLGSLWGDSYGREFSFPTLLELSRVSMPHITTMQGGFVVMSAGGQQKVIYMTEAEIKALQEENASLKKKLSDAETAAKKFEEDAKKSEADAKMAQSRASFVQMGFDPDKQGDEFALYRANPDAFKVIAPRLKAPAEKMAAPDFSKSVAPTSAPPSGGKARVKPDEFHRRVEEKMKAGASNFEAFRAVAQECEVIR